MAGGDREAVQPAVDVGEGRGDLEGGPDRAGAAVLELALSCTRALERSGGLVETVKLLQC